MRKLLIILTLAALSCEEVVVIPLPSEQNLLVVEGWVTDNLETQYVRLTRSNSFSDTINPVIDDATVLVQVRNSISHTYSYTSDGNYLSDSPFLGQSGEEYRVSIVLSNGDLIRSSWNRMEPRTDIEFINVDNFEENDPDNSSLTTTIYFPRATVRDSADYENYYRWMFFRNNLQITDPESITLQNDRFFDGNFIPNFFDSFEYDLGDNMRVELHSINKETFDYLDLLKSQITTLSAASSTTPAIVPGNISNVSQPNETVLGFFGARAVSAQSVFVQN